MYDIRDINCGRHLHPKTKIFSNTKSILDRNNIHEILCDNQLTITPKYIFGKSNKYGCMTYKINTTTNFSNN